MRAYQQTDYARKQKAKFEQAYLGKRKAHRQYRNTWGVRTSCLLDIGPTLFIICPLAGGSSFCLANEDPSAILPKDLSLVGLDVLNLRKWHLPCAHYEVDTSYRDHRTIFALETRRMVDLGVIICPWLGGSFCLA
jgi:hypothetical protein